MKKTVISVLAASLILSALYSCDDFTDNGDITKDPPVNSASGALQETEELKKPQILESPDVLTKDIEDTDSFAVEYTHSVLNTELGKTTSESYVLGFEKSELRDRYYKKTAHAEYIRDVYRTDGGATSEKLFRKEGSAGYTEISDSGEFDGFDMSAFAKFGYGYENEYTVDGFELVEEDILYSGKSCAKYKVLNAKSSIGEALSDMEITVDKKSGEWLRTEYRTENAEHDITVSSIFADTEECIVPGVVPCEITETVLYVKDGIKIEVSQPDYTDPNYAAKLTFKITNGRAIPLKVVSESFCVNGLYIAESVISDSCGGNESIIAKVNIPDSTVKLNGIKSIGSISVKLRMSDAKADRPYGYGTVWYDETEYIGTPLLSIVTDSYDKYGNTKAPDGTVITKNKGVTLTVADFEIDRNANANLSVYYENTGREKIKAVISVTEINGMAVSFADKINMQKESRGYGRFSVSKSSLAESVGQVSSAKIRVELFYPDGADSDKAIFTDEKTYNF